MKQLETDDSDNSLTLPDKLFKAHMAKQAIESEDFDSSSVKPKIISKGLGSKQGSIRNGLRDKFVLNIIESFNDQSDVLKELSNMKLDSNESQTEQRKTKRKSFSTLKKTWNSIINLAVGVPGTAEENRGRKSETLYNEKMYSTLVGDIYKSRSTACIAAL